MIDVFFVFTVVLSADADPIPGGYVVPERGNVTFTCNSSSGGQLLWMVNLTTPVQNRVTTNAVSLKGFPEFSSPDKSGDANPSSFTFHYISLENNPSPVECEDRSSREVSRATIIVEGEVFITMLCRDNTQDASVLHTLHNT